MHIGVSFIEHHGLSFRLFPPLFPVPDRSGIQDLDSVEALQEHLIQALRDLVTRNHGHNGATTFTKLLLKLPELRSLNNVHSEELLSFKVHP